MSHTFERGSFFCVKNLQLSYAQKCKIITFYQLIIDANIKAWQSTKAHRKLYSTWNIVQLHQNKEKQESGCSPDWSPERSAPLARPLATKRH
jgi:hypothetical protein